MSKPCEEVKLRVLELKDVPYMLEWMHDPETQRYFEKNMAQISEKEAIEFCLSARKHRTIDDGGSIHFAIVDDADEYLGTISLKSINVKNKNAEYAISIRRKAQGNGTAQAATRLLLKKAFEEYGLHRVYLNVLADNKRAIRFYEKCGFACEGESREHVYLRGEYRSLMWYAMLKEVYIKTGGGGTSL